VDNEDYACLLADRPVVGLGADAGDLLRNGYGDLLCGSGPSELELHHTYGCGRGSSFWRARQPVHYSATTTTPNSLGDLSSVERRVATRAASRGPAPQDPKVRHAAVQMAKHNLDVATRGYVQGLLVLVVLVVGFAALGAAGSPWWWSGAVLSVVFLLFQFRQPQRLSRRIEFLEGADHQ